MQQRTKDFLIILCGVVLVCFIFEFVRIRKDLHSNYKELKKARLQLAADKKENKELQEKISQSAQELETVSTQLNQLKDKLNSSEADNKMLLASKQDLEHKIQGLEDEKTAIQQKLHSLVELRKLIRQAKRDIYEQNLQKYLEHRRIQKEFDQQKLLSGNRGFTLKAGQTTYKPTVRIEVKPVN